METEAPPGVTQAHSNSRGAFTSLDAKLVAVFVAVLSEEVMSQQSQGNTLGSRRQAYEGATDHV